MRWFHAAVWIVLASVPVAGAVEPWREKVAPQVLETLGEPSLELLVVVRSPVTPSLAGLAAGEDKAARGRHVVETLSRAAASSQAELLELLRREGVEHRPFWIANAVWVRGDSALVETLARRADVVRIEPNPKIRLAPLPGAAPQPTPTAVEWNVSRIGADQLWALGYTGEGVVVGGQDTGYEWDHPALRNRYRGFGGLGAVHDHHWHDAIHAGGGTCGADSPVPCDDHDHGTHTMGTIVGDDGGANRIGIAPEAVWIGCRNMDQGFGTPATYLECFQWFVAPTDLDGLNPDPALAPHVINNSWACPPFEGCAADTLRTAVENVRAAGIVVVASAGNSGSACGSVSDPPAIYDAAFSVGATSSSDAIASFSSRGPVTVDGSERLKPDVSAPGVGIRSAVRGGDYASFSGTSMAGPHVAGLVALLLDARPDLAGDVDTIEELIRRSALPLTSTQTCGSVSGESVPNHTFGHGRVDAVAMLLGDADADGADNLEDCRPADVSTWSAPAAVSDLRLGGGPSTTLTWSPRDGGDVHYDVLRADSPAGLADAACVVSGSTSTQTIDATVPSSLQVYVVRARNACGSAAGPASSGPRPLPVCP